MPRGRSSRRRPLLSYYTAEPVDPVRSRTMSRIRGKDTGLERRFRRAVWAAGVRYRCYPKDVPGRPDLVNHRARVAVFLDGCFWHGCPKHFRPPRTRSTFWTEKIRRNRETRKRVLRQLSDGWTVLEFYECEVNADFDACVAKVVGLVKSARLGSGRRLDKP